MKIAKRCGCCDGGALARTPAVLAPFIASRVFDWEPTEITADWGLRDIRQGNAYTVCNTLECVDCGFVFLDMRFDDEEMAALYKGYRDAGYCALRDRFEPGYAARNNTFGAQAEYIPKVEAFLAPYMPAAPRILDFGGDTGMNTPLQGRAAAFHIHDISDVAPVKGATRVSYEEARARAYDLIVSIQVLEHVADPRAHIREIAGLMKPETLLYLELPFEEMMRTDGGNMSRGSRKRHWHEHINFFSEKALHRLLADSSLEIVASQLMPIYAAARHSIVFSVIARKGDGAKSG